MSHQARLIDVSQLAQALALFAKNRDWDQFHTPRNLVMALTGEVGVRVRADFPTLKGIIIRERDRHKPHKILIEEAASGIGLIQELKASGIYQVEGIRPDKDKQCRLLGVTPMLESGKVKLPEQASWLPEFLRELLSFPSAKHDDQVDALTQGLGYMRERLEEPGIFGFYRNQAEQAGRGG